MQVYLFTYLSHLKKGTKNCKRDPGKLKDRDKELQVFENREEILPIIL
jgi:hypothetical protein